MARPGLKSDQICQEIIERVSVGQTLTSICLDETMPHMSNLMRWLDKDTEFDDRMHRARIRGTLTQADEAVDAQRGVIDGTAAQGDPKRLQAVVTAANNMGHQANAKLSKIDNRYKDKQEVQHTGPMLIGWDTGPVDDDERFMPDNVLDHITSEDVPN